MSFECARAWVFYRPRLKPLNLCKTLSAAQSPWS